LKGLILKANLQAALAHLPRAQVRLKRAEADHLSLPIGIVHLETPTISSV